MYPDFCRQPEKGSHHTNRRYYAKKGLSAPSHIIGLHTCDSLPAANSKGEGYFSPGCRFREPPQGWERRCGVSG